MKTLKKVLVFSLMIQFFALGALSAQNAPTTTPKDSEKPALTTMMAYNNYIAKIDVKKLSKNEKVWLAEQYNNIIEKIDAQYHNPQKAEYSKVSSKQAIVILAKAN